MLKHFGLDVPPIRSSELWADTEFSAAVREFEPLDLLLFNDTESSWGAHVAVYLGDGVVAHLSKQIGFPQVCTVEDMLRNPKYRVLIGTKRIKAPKKMDITPLRVVFLDIDGVLNSDRYVRERPPAPAGTFWSVDDLDPVGIEALNRIVERTGAKFVLSSSWRHHHTLEEITVLFRTRGFVGELIDVTPRLFGEPRGAEIRTWLCVQTAPPAAFAVLDDDAATNDLEPFWVRTDPAYGVAASDVERLVALLMSSAPHST